MIVLQEIFREKIYHCVKNLDELRDDLTFIGKVKSFNYYVGVFGDIYLVKEDVDNGKMDANNQT